MVFFKKKIYVYVEERGEYCIQEYLSFIQRKKNDALINVLLSHFKD